MAQDYKTMRVPEDAYEAAKDSKRDGETWGQFLQRCTNTPPEFREYVEVDDVVGELVAEIDSMAFNGQVSDDRADEIIGRLEDLENTIPRRVAEELQR